jgi:hypothetical protein
LQALSFLVVCVAEATVAEWMNFFEHGEPRKGVVDAKAPIPEGIKRDVERALAEKMDELKKGQADEKRTEAMLLRIYDCRGLSSRIREVAARRMGENAVFSRKSSPFINSLVA